MRMLLKWLCLAAAVIMIQGCGANNDGVGGAGKGALPIGYYSNENHEKDGKSILNADDNDGPLTEFLDHTMGAEGTNENPERQDLMRQQKQTRGHNEMYEQIEKVNSSAKDVRGVEDAATIFSGDQVLVAVKLKEGNQSETVKEDVRQQVRERANGQSLTVITDTEVYNRVKRLENQLINGNPPERIKEEMDKILRTNINK